jgi:hypothetical protein
VELTSDLFRRRARGAAADPCDDAAQKQRGPVPVEAVPFIEVVDTRWRYKPKRKRAVETADEAQAREKYREIRARFLEEHGAFCESYWGSRLRWGVMLTARRPNRLLSWLGWSRETYQIHRVSDDATKAVPSVGHALYAMDNLAWRVRAVLRGPSLSAAMHWLAALMANVLREVDDKVDKQGKLTRAQEKQLLATHEEEFRRIEDYYRHAAIRCAHIAYVRGMVMGALVSAAFALGAVFFVKHAVPWLWGMTVPGEDVAGFLGCFAAGGLGAVVSVLARMSSSSSAFTIEYEVPKSSLRCLGMFRPFIGGVFGVAFFFAIKSQLMDVAGSKPGFFAVAFFAFLAGFSERWAKDILWSGAPAPGSGGQSQPVAAKSPTGASAVSPQS